MYRYLLKVSLMFLVTSYGTISSINAEEISDSLIYLQEGIGDLKKSEKIIALDVWNKWVANQGNYDILTLFAPTISDFLNMIKNQKISYAFLDGSHFIEHYSQIKPNLNGEFWMVQRTSNPLEEFVLVVRKDKGDNDLITFRNRSLSIYSGYGLLNMYMAYMVRLTAQTSIDNYFSKIRYTKSESHSVLDVYFGYSDICLVAKHVLDDAIELNPAIQDKLKIIHRSGERFIPAVVIALNDATEKAQNRFNQSIEKLHKTARGKQLLTLFGIHAIKKIKHETLYPMIKLNM